MRTDILIISDQLVEPPTDTMAFRTVTMIIRDNLNMTILLQTTQEMKDLYYHWMKPKGLLDFIEYIIDETENEEGIRLATTRKYPHTIATKAIRFENQLHLIGQIKWLANIP